MKRKILIIAILTLVLTGVYAKDYSLVCLQNGEKIEFSKCRADMSDWICSSDSCQYCVFLSTTGAYCPASMSQCNAIGATCSDDDNGGGGGTTIDQEAPTINLDELEELYSSRYVEISATSDEPADWKYKDNSASREYWRSLCRNTDSCETRLRVTEGFNNITIKAEDSVGNPSYKEISFFVDTRNPRVQRTEPRTRSFADGFFSVTFSEQNPERVTLFYGNKSQDINPEDCYQDRTRTTCTTEVDLDEFDGQQIEYYFEVEDIVGNTDKSRTSEVYVDTTLPTIDNEDFFTYTPGERYAFFNIEITEENLYKVYYTFTDYRGQERERRLCSSRLRDGVCTSRKYFLEGEQQITLVVEDKAGNSIGVPINFEVTR